MDDIVFVYESFSFTMVVVIQQFEIGAVRQLIILFHDYILNFDILRSHSKLL